MISVGSSSPLRGAATCSTGRASRGLSSCHHRPCEGRGSNLKIGQVLIERHPQVIIAPVRGSNGMPTVGDRAAGWVIIAPVRGSNLAYPASHAFTAPRHHRPCEGQQRLDVRDLGLQVRAVIIAPVRGSNCITNPCTPMRCRVIIAPVRGSNWCGSFESDLVSPHHHRPCEGQQQEAVVGSDGSQTHPQTSSVRTGVLGCRRATMFLRRSQAAQDYLGQEGVPPGRHR